MTDRALRYFLAVVRAGSVRAAAAALHVAASAVSRQVAELEAEIGQPLLERLPRGVVPTEAGRLLADHARRREDESVALRDELARRRGRRGGTVRIVCGDGFLVDLFANGIRPLATAYPDIAVEVALGTTDGILRAVAEGEADLGLAYNPPGGPGIVALATCRQPLALLVPAGDTLADETRPLRLRDAADRPCVLLPPDHGIRRLLGRVEADDAIRLRPRLVSGAFDLHRRFVAAGLGLAFLPAFTVPAEERAAIVMRPLADSLLADATVHLLARSGRRLPDAVEAAAGLLATGLDCLRA